MAKMLQCECDGEIPFTMSINTFIHIEFHLNTLKHTINALKYIINTLKYTINIL
jgi:hypothetical protein